MVAVPSTTPRYRFTAIVSALRNSNTLPVPAVVASQATAPGYHVGNLPSRGRGVWREH
jgi:hypothetical protein